MIRKDLHPVLRLPLRLVALLRFILLFVRELILSNWQVARAVVLGRRDDILTALVTYPSGHLRPIEILMLSHCITLTPGTTTLEVSEDRQTLVLHVFDGRDPEGVVRSIQENLEAPIVAFMR